MNDELISLLAHLPGPVRPALTLQGLGLMWDDAISSPFNHEKTTGGSVDEIGLVNGNGQAHDSARHLVDEDEQPQPTTPKIDKGKGKAEPEPEELEKVLSPTFLITESEDEDDDGHRFPAEEGEGGEEVVSPSPTDRQVSCPSQPCSFEEICKSGRGAG
jgi:protein phosphatase 1 regulatory subunit 37